MRFRIELFVDDLDASIRLYGSALGFRLIRREADYASLERGGAVLGLGSIAKLPADGALTLEGGLRRAWRGSEC
jgi:catechol 2,3-dioxygenase-like lactoylglutathione lyase family enzyme